ncbi:MAG: DUF6644 family protein [Steroidobacteraceae bacterium]
MLREFAAWLAATPLSHTLQEVTWIVPASQSLHIMALAVVFSSALMINLRLLGLGAGGRSVSQLAGTLVPWMWRGLAALALTGALQTIAEPVRQFVAPLFWTKMALIVLVAAATATFSGAVRRNATLWDAPATRPRAARWFALGSTLLWFAIIVCGRFIGYTWAFYA